MKKKEEEEEEKKRKIERKKTSKEKKMKKSPASCTELTFKCSLQDAKEKKKKKKKEREREREKEQKQAQKFYQKEGEISDSGDKNHTLYTNSLSRALGPKLLMLSF